VISNSNTIIPNGGSVNLNANFNIILKIKTSFDRIQDRSNYKVFTKMEKLRKFILKIQKLVLEESIGKVIIILLIYITLLLLSLKINFIIYFLFILIFFDLSSKVKTICHVSIFHQK
jgi:hypothetical protein